MSFGRLARTPVRPPMSDINMTPLIDVMLVLLVIFMITAPLMTSSLKLELPRADGARPTDASQFVTVAVDTAGRLFWGDEPVTAEALKLRVREAAMRNPAMEVQLRADKSVSYGQIAELIGLVQDSGIARIGFVTETGAAQPP